MLVSPVKAVKSTSKFIDSGIFFEPLTVPLLCLSLQVTFIFISSFVQVMVLVFMPPPPTHKSKRYSSGDDFDWALMSVLPCKGNKDGPLIFWGPYRLQEFMATSLSVKTKSITVKDFPNSHVSSSSNKSYPHEFFFRFLCSSFP